MGAEIFWELFFFILGIIFFFYGFNWRRRFRWGWAVPAEEVGLKKNSWRGVGGEGAAPPPQMHSQNMLRDSPSVRMIFGALGSQFLFGALGSYNFEALGALMIWCCVQKLVVSSQNF